MHNAAADGDVELVVFLPEQRTKGSTPEAVASLAAQGHHVELIEWVFERNPENVNMLKVATKCEESGAVVMSALLLERMELVCGTSQQIDSTWSSHRARLILRIDYALYDTVCKDKQHTAGSACVVYNNWTHTLPLAGLILARDASFRLVSTRCLYAKCRHADGQDT